MTNLPGVGAVPAAWRNLEALKEAILLSLDQPPELAAPATEVTEGMLASLRVFLVHGDDAAQEDSQKGGRVRTPPGGHLH